MGRVKLEVTADASDAISQMTKLGQAIKTAMSGFDSKGIDTWSGSVAKAITSINDRFSDIQKKIESLNKTFETKVTYGGTESLTTFKESLKVAKEALTDFSKVFSTSMTFGANDSVVKFQANIQKADEALTAFKEKMRTRPGFGASSDIASVKDKLKNTTDSVATFNKALAAKPVMGAAQELAAFEARLKEFSQNIGTHIAPIYITLNNVKDAMTGLSSVLNNVQQPTWVEPFTKSMWKVVSVLKAIAIEYKAVKKEIEAPINAGGGGAARELKFTEAAARSMSKGVRTFYRHIRQEFKETRQAATETSRAIRDAMAMIQGGGAGGAGGSSAAGGQRLGFGEQLWSRMRSNMYSYLTMWFGVAGAIRAANGVLEEHNMLLEKGREYNKQGYDALGELYLKAGSKAKGDEYAEFSRRLAREGNFGSNEEAYNFASFALMSGLSKEDMRDLAPIFRSKVAKQSDQRALMSAISYIKKQYGDQYSAKQISGMIMEANLYGPSDIGPTANAVQDVIEIGKALNIPLPDLIALIGAGSGLNKDARIKTAIRAYLSKVREKGLEPVIMAESMGLGAGAYYKDKNTGFYKFTDEALQKQFEEDVAAGRETVTMEMLMQLPAGRGRDIVREIGGGLRAGTGAMIMGNMGKNPEDFNKIQAAIWAIANGDTSRMDEAIEAAQMITGSGAEITAQGVSNTVGQLMGGEAAMEKSYVSLRALYDSRYGSSFFHSLHKLLNEGRFSGAASESGGINSVERLQARGVWFQNAYSYLESIQKDSSFTEEEKKLAEDAFINMIRGLIEMYAKEHSIDINTPEGVNRAAEFLGFSTIAGGVMPSRAGTRGAEGMAEYIRRARDISVKAVTPTSSTIPTATARAVKAASGAKTENAYLAEQDRLKEERAEAKAASAEAKQADRDAKRADKEEKQARKNFLNSLPKAALSAPANAVIESALGVALTDSSADLQQMRDVALNSDISGRTGGNILGKAFYAYASDKTDAKADKEIVNQLVASLNEQGFSLVGIKNIAQAFAQEGMVEGSPGWTAENAKKYEKFFTDIRDYLEAISKGTAEMATVRKFPKRSTPKSSKK